MEKKIKLDIKNGLLNFQCRGSKCKENCCGPFEGLHYNIKNIEHRPFDEIILTNEDYKRLYKNGYADIIEIKASSQMNKDYYKMSLHPDGTCKAFNKGKCTINEIKPTLCKAFPFYFDMFSGLCAIMCEGFSDNYCTELSDLNECFEAARKMYAFWIDFYTPKKDTDEPK